MPKRVLVAGATGFVGSHLVPALMAAGFDVLAGARHVEGAAQKHPDWRFCQLDLNDPGSIDSAMSEIDVACYLVHAMADGKNWEETERKQARAFRDAAEWRRIEHIVYLGGMQPRGKVSRHLASRLYTGEILRSGRVPTIELQATMIVGAGSESFRIVRDLAARLPWMVLPKWLESVTEPVAIADVVAALVHAASIPLPESRIVTLPGPEQVTGKDILLRTAHALGQDPKAISVPLVSPRLSSYWIGLVTRANMHIATELVEGLRSDITAQGTQIWPELPSYRRTPLDEAIASALKEEAQGLPETTRLVEGVLHKLAASH